MYAGLGVSLILHLGILAWAFFSLQSMSKLDLPEVPTIEAELITVDEFTRLKQGDPNAKKLEAKVKDKPKAKIAEKEAPKPKPKAAPPPPAAEPPPPEEMAKKDKPEPVPPPKSDPIADKLAALTPPPPPTPSVEERKKLEDERKKKAEEKKAKDKAKKKAAEKKRKELEVKKRKAKQKKKKKKKDFAQSMKALLDKTPEKRGAPLASAEPTKPTDYTGPTAGEREGSGNKLTAREEDLLRSRIDGQLRSCWRLPGGGGGIETAVVYLSWRLNKDGSLAAQPQIVNGSSDPVFKIAAEAAIRAVNCAAPFTLPADTYDAWKKIEKWEFDPSHMM